jgi:hypothetical protein
MGKQTITICSKNISFDEELYDWLEMLQAKDKRFSPSALINRALYELKNTKSEYEISILGESRSFAKKKRDPQ